MAHKKIVCLGAGSAYFRSVLSDLAVAEGLAGSEITLYDIDLEKLELMARLGRRLAEEAGMGLRVRPCADLAEAVDGADFAISSIGGVGPSGEDVYATSVRRGDILIPARYGIFQIVGDTGGPAGMMMGLRSIPIYLSICREMEKRCPEVVFLNHSNPMAILCRAMRKYTQLEHIIGICHGVQGGLSNIASVLDVPVEELDTIWIGTNHYYWFLRIRHRGRDVYPELRRRMAARIPPEGQVFSSKLSQIYGYQIVYPHDGHVLEFYPFFAQASDAASLPYGLQMQMPPEDLMASAQSELPEAERRARREAPVDASGPAQNGRAARSMGTCPPAQGRTVTRNRVRCANSASDAPRSRPRATRAASMALSTWLTRISPPRLLARLRYRLLSSRRSS